MCHRAGQTRSTALLLEYGPGDWCALHRDLHGDLIFPSKLSSTSPGPRPNGVSTLRSGSRLTLGLIFHDAT